jgi:hypothetical protein
VADHPHDVGLMSLFVEGVAHGFTVDGEAFIGLAIGCIPTLQGAIESLGVDADEAIPEDGFARHLISAVDPPAAESLAGFGTEALSPARNRLVTAHAAQDRPGSYA